MVSIKKAEDIKKMEEGGKILATILEKVKEKVEPGVRTNQLNQIAEKLIAEYGAKPSFKGYNNFPAALCTSLNEVVVHGAPSDYKLKRGDLLSLDLGIFYKGFHTDMAITLGVGNINKKKERLLKTTKEALNIALSQMKPGNTIGDIGNAVQKHSEAQGYNVVRNLCGHGIGKILHQQPEILNYGRKGKGLVLKKNMTLCPEPMLTVGSYELEKEKDGQGFKTKDNSLTAHFEHTVLITEDGNKVLTKVS